MPKNKKKAESSSDTSVHSSDEESKKPSKKQKTDNKKKSPDDDSMGSWDLGKMKFVKVREFKGRTFVDIREFYLDKNDAEMKPGRKGISLSAEQWNKFTTLVKEIDETLKKNC